MSLFTKPFLRIQSGLTITPDPGAPFSAAPVKLALDFTRADDAAAGYAARIIFGAAAQTAALSSAGAITLSGAGTRQVETSTINPGGGATSNGNLIVTVTKTGLAGSPLAIPVALRANAHNSSTKVAAAIRDALNANAAFAAVLEALEMDSNQVRVRTIYPAADDATFNIAVAAGLGITAAATSAATTAGVAGVVVERLGGAAEDAFGVTYPAHSQIIGIAAHMVKGGSFVVSDNLTTIAPGDVVAKASASYINEDMFAADGTGILDVLILTK